MRDNEFRDALRGYLDRRAGRVRPVQIEWPRDRRHSIVGPVAFGAVVAIMFGGIILAGFALHRSPSSGPVAPSIGVVGSAGTPPVRCCAAIAYDPDTRQTVMFGGLGAHGSLGDTWVWTGSGWITPHLTFGPSSRVGASMVYDAKMHALVLIGGDPDSPAGPSQRAGLTATWLWTGGSWQQLHTAHAPVSNSLDMWLRGPMAYDAATRRVVLVTTQEQIHFQACSTDTWTFDGSDWRHEQPAADLPASLSALTEEPQSGHVIAVLAPRAAVAPQGLMGTSCPPGSPAARALTQSSTWRWTGTTWVQVGAGTEPGGSGLALSRNGTSIELGAVSGRAMVLTADDEQLWAWNGVRWIAVLAPKHGPAPRTGSAQSVDGEGHVLLYGGESNAGEVNNALASDTWVWDGSRWTEWVGPPPATSSPSPAIWTPRGP